MRAKSVQNQPGLRVRREFAPFDLPSDFPVYLGRRHSPSAQPIGRMHLHDCLEFGYCHRGAGIFVVENKVLPFAAGDVTVINDCEMHLAQSAPEAMSVWTFVMLDPARLLGASSADRDLLRSAPLCGPHFSNVLKHDTCPEAVALMRQLMEELESARPGFRTVARGLVLAIMGLLHRLPGLSTRPPARKKRDAAEHIAPALDYLSHAYAEPVSVPGLARLCGASESNLRRLFLQVAGRSPRDYVTYLRVQMSTSLLEGTRLRVLDIAYRVGYPTLSSFNRHFARIMKCSPREWRSRATARGPGEDGERRLRRGKAEHGS